jgi:7,8-dihydropterin-6-yl-methyl-4-(beta-D-ribofuranosyl)aminobenzene 5'-phosphate synthase
MAKGSGTGGVRALDELKIVVIVDNETDTLSSIDPDVPQSPEVAGLVARTEPDRHHDGHECRTVFDRLCCACHGLSVLLTGRSEGQQHSVLFDVGPYPELWLANAERLGVDLAAIECVFLSHWHFDHSGGLPQVLGAITAARKRSGRPPPVMDLHPDRPDQRGFLLPSGVMVMLPEEPTLDAIAAAGAEVVSRGDVHAVCDGFFYGSGRIARTTAYETGLPGHHSFRGGHGEPDPLIMDERFLAARVRGRGVSVFSACSHAGIVNVCLGAGEAFPGERIDLVLGGFHLAGKTMEQRIEETVEDLRTRIAPALVAPGHCTGWRAKTALAGVFAPGRYAPSVVGTVYRLNAAS